MIRTEQLSRHFDDVIALNNTDIHIKAQQTTVIMGGSGSGKTTLLRLLAGLECPTSGHICYGDDDLNGMSQKRLYQ